MLHTCCSTLIGGGTRGAMGVIIIAPLKSNLKRLSCLSHAWLTGSKTTKILKISFRFGRRSTSPSGSRTHPLLPARWPFMAKKITPWVKITVPLPVSTLAISIPRTEMQSRLIKLKYYVKYQICYYMFIGRKTQPCVWKGLTLIKSISHSVTATCKEHEVQS